MVKYKNLIRLESKEEFDRNLQLYGFFRNYKCSDDVLALRQFPCWIALKRWTDKFIDGCAYEWQTARFSDIKDAWCKCEEEISELQKIEKELEKSLP